LSTTLSTGEEAVVVELRKTLMLPLDDLLVVTREFINKLASRSGIDRCLRRHGVANLRQLQSDERGGDAPVVKTFKSYVPGFVHVDIKYLPQMPDETSRRYLFVAIDRATRWVHLAIYNDQTEASSTHFLRSLMKAAPMKITKILTDNGSQFTDRFTTRTTVHALDVAASEPFPDPARRYSFRSRSHRGVGYGCPIGLRGTWRGGEPARTGGGGAS
jgi:Integrase core domain